MPPIGETLREARLRQSIEIAEVEQATKIRAKYLRALEGEEFDRLPGSTFVRQFLRTYAEYLGLDSQLLVEEYRRRHESPGSDEVQQLAPPPPPPRTGGREGRRRPQGPGRGTIIVGAAIALLAVIIVIGLVAGDDQGEGERPTDTAEEPRGEGRGQGQGGRQRRGQESGGDRKVRLTVSPVAETYVCVEDGEGEQLFESTIAEEESFSGEVLRVNLGNTQVDLEVNGEEFPVEESANPVGFEFTPDGGEELPEGERPCT